MFDVNKSFEFLFSTDVTGYILLKGEKYSAANDNKIMAVKSDFSINKDIGT
jgi:hypothetical protein